MLKLPVGPGQNRHAGPGQPEPEPLGMGAAPVGTSISRWAMGLFYSLAGLNHFWHPAFYEALIPPGLPWAEGLNLLSGVAEVGLGVALCWPNGVLNRWAAWGVMLLLLAIYPANIYMALNPNRFSALAPVWGLWLRLPLQLVLWAWAWQHTRRPRLPSSLEVWPQQGRGVDAHTC